MTYLKFFLRFKRIAKKIKTGNKSTLMIFRPKNKFPINQSIHKDPEREHTKMTKTAMLD